MPKSPNWCRDELILALDLYFREPRARGSKSHPGVGKLSAILNKFPVHPSHDREGYLRNPNGVAMKLGNFLPFDPEYDGRGLSQGGKLDKEVWEEFLGVDRKRLRQAADEVLRRVGAIEPYTIDDAHEDLFIARTHFERLLGSIRTRRNLILQGPPGTGKTFIARRIAWCLRRQSGVRILIPSRWCSFTSRMHTRTSYRGTDPHRTAVLTSRTACSTAFASEP